MNNDLAALEFPFENKQFWVRCYTLEHFLDLFSSE